MSDGDRYDNGKRCKDCIHCCAVIFDGTTAVCDAQPLNNPPPRKMYYLFPAERHGCMQFWRDSRPPTEMESRKMEAFLKAHRQSVSCVADYYNTATIAQKVKEKWDA